MAYKFNNMQKLIPPLFLFICVLIMITLHFIFPVQIIIRSPYNYLGIVILISGLTIAKKTGQLFSKMETEIHTFKKPEKLVTDVFFQYTRNPIYMSFVMILIGLNIVLGSLSPFALIIIFILVTNFWYIPFEERKMQEQFGQEYENYKKAVKRWI